MTTLSETHKKNELIKKQRKESIDDLLTRQEKILNYVFKHKIAKSSQIYRDCMHEVHISNAYKTIARLCKNGLLIKNTLFEKKHPFFTYSISQKGLLFLKEISYYEITKPVLKSQSPRHDLKLLDIVETLKKSQSISEIITENVLQSCKEIQYDPVLFHFYYMKSDAFIKYPAEDFTLKFALEYERTLKSRSRYVEKFKRYYERQPVHAILSS